MARIARIVVPGVPHHITQRGNRRMQTFFTDADYREYLYLMAEWCNRCNIEVWSYCLMPNHTHLIVVPENEDGLRRAIGEAHRRYTRYINFQKGWKGHLWQSRFSSFPMDEEHLIAASRYIELNPVRAKLVKYPENFKWSSCRAHLQNENDILVKARPLLELIPNWKDFLMTFPSEDDLQRLRLHERTGRPLGDDNFINNLEILTSRSLKRKKPGPKKSN